MSEDFASRPRYLLDTNVIRELVVGSGQVADIEARYGLLTCPFGQVWVSYVVVAELQVLGRNWDGLRRENSERVMSKFSVISRFDDSLLRAYVAIDIYSRESAGRRMGKNDL